MSEPIQLEPKDLAALREDILYNKLPYLRIPDPDDAVEVVDRVIEALAEPARVLAEQAWDAGFMAALLLRDVGMPARNPYLPSTALDGLDKLP